MMTTLQALRDLQDKLNRLQSAHDAEVGALRAEIAVLEDHAAMARALLKEADNEADAAESRLREAERDARRYRWLRDECVWALANDPIGARLTVHMAGVSLSAIGPDDDDFDAAIDRAMEGDDG